jgi:intron-binding protein aquarius
LRDVRRLVVAMSRARLGMYIFGRISLFTNCFELTRTFNQLLQKPVRLHLLPQEKKPMDQPLSTTRLASDPVDPAQVLEVRDVLHMGELIAAMTLSVQSEYGEYTRRIQAAQEAERLKREQREQAQREYAEAREATMRAEAQQEALAAREIAHERETATMEKEMQAEEGAHNATVRQKSRRQQAVEEVDSDASGSGEDE